MKKYILIKIFVLLFALFAIAACGGGGGGDSSPDGGNGDGADSVSYLISGGTTTVRTETFDLNVPTIHYNPYIHGHYVVSSGRTYLYSYSEHNGSSFNEILQIIFVGNSPGTYTIGGGNLVSLSVAYTMSYTATSGTITVNALDAVGGHISGTFDVTDGSHQMSGTFSITREVDQ
jgi:hypothetical protein